jgi:molybdopterin converting factor small subunit
MAEPTVTLLLFAQAREAAGRPRDAIAGETVGEVLDVAMVRYGEHFAHVLAHCRVWCNGEPATRATPVRPGDEVAVLPPVSGG